MEKICIVGSGNWGSAIAKIIGRNATRFPKLFHPTVNMWVFEELIEGKKLSEIINSKHENVKYLPGICLPENVVAVPDLAEASKDASILIFVIPHQFVARTIEPLRNSIRSGCRAISLIKGIETQSGEMNLISSYIHDNLGIDVSVLMGANIANEVAQEHFCESTLGYKVRENAETLHCLLNTEWFRVALIEDVAAVELCGALKNVVAVAAGFVDGLKLGENTKAAIIRIGILEMIRFCQVFYPNTKQSTFFESCGIADVITTCFGGRNRKVAEAFAACKGQRSIEELEEEMLNGQKLQGPDTSRDIYNKLSAIGKTDEFPLFTAVYAICYENHPVEELFSLI